MFWVDYLIEKGLDKTIDYVYNTYILPNWNNADKLHTFILILLVVIVVLVWFLTKYFKENQELQKYKPQISSFKELCIRISLLLEDNNKYYRSFAPNSSAVNSDEPLREDTTLWEDIKKNKLVPNNQAILNLITTNKDLIPSEHQDKFTKMEFHIAAFDAHVRNPQFEYSQYMFPKDFDKLIRNECFDINAKHSADIKTWLNTELKKENILVLEKYIYGSILHNYYRNIKDIDLLILYEAKTHCDISNINVKLNRICKKFKSKYRKHLHLSAFSTIEQQTYTTYKDKIEYKQEV